MMMNKRCKTILPYLRWANIKTWMEYPHFVPNKNKFLKIEFFFFFYYAYNKGMHMYLFLCNGTTRPILQYLSVKKTRRTLILL